MKTVIAIDGGGTKTIAVLVHDQRVVAYTKVGGTNLASVDTNKIQALLKQAMNDLETQAERAFASVSAVFAGMSGGGRATEQLKVKRSLQPYVSANAKIIVDSDVLSALYSGTFGERGIVSIAGTGAVVYGINARGEYARVGGWGYLFEDAGSGFELGRQAILRSMHNDDQNRTLTHLDQAVLQHYDVENMQALIPIIYENGKERERIASFSPVLSQLASAGDLEANEIISHARVKQADAIKQVKSQLFQQDEACVVVLAGSVYQELHLWKPFFEKSLDLVKVTRPKYQPIAGAIVACDLTMQQMRTKEAYEKLFEMLP
ncbi:BadF/BadG/BcrA/BcrD ATPase family protein [Geomicrobium sediminis]|uniref:N-acetylglucosamine kinase-like BadF-type ATPase n=1 Tax=Geomicrobium sediminis TaxID=1347788 RepID=A0ABS2PAJ0_9BACL|nr:BadF/BadG/BcrA/BcrD ATPase family protein [Geomicrobium sediminis]MBM7632438.1 N-acetylglucosamine kinase-like BadF-type ATPase [Geomicrobium sediminis]